MAVEPKTRGLETSTTDSNLSKSTSSVVSNEIKKVISFGHRWIQVEMTDGSVLKRSEGTLAWRYNNPGNLLFTDFSKSFGAVGSGHNGMSVFPTLVHGEKAMQFLLFREGGRYIDLSIQKAISIYAPDHENDTPAYIEFVCRKAKLSRTRILRTLNNEERKDLVEAMRSMEKYSEGTIEKVK